MIDVLSTAEAAAELNVSEDTVVRLITRGELRAYKVGRAYRIARADLDAYLEAVATK